MIISIWLKQGLNEQRPLCHPDPYFEHLENGILKWIYWVSNILHILQFLYGYIFF